ncbi:MAG TPA: S26 family signal peptidase [Devosia sp.]|nr:S26 family signal peptidase [Devosia sp.]
MTNRKSNVRWRNLLTPRGAGAVLAACALCVYAARAPGSPQRALFIWNASASAPLGLYRVTHGRALSRGRLVLAIPAPPLAAFAARRGYLPSGVPLVKRIAAVAGDAVCAHGIAIFINGRLAAARLAMDGKGRPLPAWSGCRMLEQGEVFLLMANVRASFDGRYFGPTKASQIVGTLEPLWTR